MDRGLFNDFASVIRRSEKSVKDIWMSDDGTFIKIIFEFGFEKDIRTILVGGVDDLTALKRIVSAI